MFDVVRTLEEGADTVSSGTEELNRRMLMRVGEFANASLNKRAIQKIVRDPGFQTKLLWSDSSADGRFYSLVGRVIGERIDGIVQGSRQEMIAQALTPAKISAEMVTVSRGTAIVKAPSSEMGKAVGKNGNNVSLAERLLEMRITIVRESGNE
jgi:transcription antitermination factor NusA-like protein